MQGKEVTYHLCLFSGTGIVARAFRIQANGSPAVLNPQFYFVVLFTSDSKMQILKTVGLDNIQRSYKSLTGRRKLWQRVEVRFNLSFFKSGISFATYQPNL